MVKSVDQQRKSGNVLRNWKDCTGFSMVEIEVFKTKKIRLAQKTQEQLASDLGMDVRTLQNYKLLAEMIPELEELLKI